MGCFSSKHEKQCCSQQCCSCCGCCGCCIPAGSVLYDHDDPLPQSKQLVEVPAPKAFPCVPNVPGFPGSAPTIAASDSTEEDDEQALPSESLQQQQQVLGSCLPSGLAQPLGQAQISCFNLSLRGNYTIRALIAHLRARGYPVPQSVVNNADAVPHDFASIATQSAVSSLYSAVTQLQEDGVGMDDDADSFCSVPSGACSVVDQGTHGARPHVGRSHASPLQHQLSDSNLPSLAAQPGPWPTGAHAPHASHHHMHHPQPQQGHQHSPHAHQHAHHASQAAHHASHHLGGALHLPGQQHPALEAFKRGSLGFSFSGGGFFFPYHLGIVIQLSDMGIITPATPLAGASCGSIIVSCVNAGLDLHGLVPQLLEFASDCRTFGTAGRLKSVIEHFMTRALPHDAAERCRGHTFLSLTKVFPFLRPVVISDYTDKEDLVGAIATSCHIPAYNDGSFMARFRDQYWVDGGLVRHIPALPAESGATWVAGISCVPFKFLESLPGVQRLKLLRSLAVSPDMFFKFPFGWHEVGGLVLAPAEDPVLLKMVEMGKRDILRWASVVGLTAHLSGSSWVPRSLSAAPSAPAALNSASPSPGPSRTRSHGGSGAVSPRLAAAAGGGGGSPSGGSAARSSRSGMATGTGHVRPVGGSSSQTGGVQPGGQAGTSSASQTDMTPSQTQVMLTGVLSQLGIEVDEEQWFDAQEEAAAAASSMHGRQGDTSSPHAHDVSVMC